MPVNSSIAMSGRQFQLDNPIDVQGKVATLRQLAGQQELQQMQIQQARQTQDQERTLADLYKGNVGPDGTINRQGMFTAAAERGLGAKIPAMQKQFAEADKATADVKHTGAQTGELEWKVAKGKIEASGAALSSLLANPNTTHDEVIQTMVGLVNRGIVTPEQGQQAIRELPGDPVRLRQYLVQKGMEVMEAGKRMEMMAPKRQEVNDGKTTQFVDVNPYTNPQGPAPIKMQTTPGQDQSNATQVRGQNQVDARARDANGIAQTSARTQVVEGPDGFMLIDKGTGLARPAATFNGAQVQGKSSMTEDQGKATGWLAQATNSWNNMNKAIKKDSGAAKPGFGDAVGAIPLMGAAGRYATGSARQEFTQAASSLSESLLRAATGAGVNANEAKQKIEELTPQFGDTDDRIKQKMDSIPIYIESLKVRAGPGAKKIAGMGIPTDATPGSTNAVPDDIAAILKKHGGK